MEQINLKLTGVSPLLMHCDRFANPLDLMTKAHKQLTSKRKKTDDNHEDIARSEWMGGIYWDDAVGVYLPGQNIEACIREGAKLQRLGAAVKRGLMVLDDKAKLLYTGPKDIERLYEKREFVDIRSVKVGTAKLMRCRPKFNEWSLECSVVINPEVLEARDVIKAAEDAGLMCGLGDYRPRFGRFEVEVLS